MLPSLCTGAGRDFAVNFDHVIRLGLSEPKSLPLHWTGSRALQGFDRLGCVPVQVACPVLCDSSATLS